jgi:hypothetical protein
MSRTTVTVVYDRVNGEGFVTARVGAGTFVSDAVPRIKARRHRPTGSLRPRPIWDDLALAAATPRPIAFDFRTWIPDTTRFPWATWRQLVARELRPGAVARSFTADPAGHLGLREAIARHIGTSRGVTADPGDVTVTNGIQQAVDLVTRVLLSPGDRVAMEDPGHAPAFRLFRSLDLDVIGVPVDDQGPVVDALPRGAWLTRGRTMGAGWTSSSGAAARRPRTRPGASARCPRPSTGSGTSPSPGACVTSRSPTRPCSPSDISTTRSTRRFTMDEQARQSAFISALITEHFVLQSASSTTVSEAGARASLYVFSLSSSMVALGFTAQTDTFGPFVGTILPVLFVLGWFTVVRLVDTAVGNKRLQEAITHVRAYYRTLTPEAPLYFAPWEPSPEEADEADEALAMLGTKHGRLAILSTTASMVAVVNGLVGGIGVALLVAALDDGHNRPLAIALGGVATLACLGAAFAYQLRRYRAADIADRLRWQQQRQGQAQV